MFEEDNLPSKKKLKPAEFTNGKSNAVRDHYNKLKIQNFNERKKSRFIRLRYFNNWIKSSLLNRFCALTSLQLDDGQKFNVVDLCGGKFGDLPKWMCQAREGCVQYVALIDISEEEVKEARARFNGALEDLPENSVSGGIPHAEFFVADCFKADIPSYFKEETPFGLVSCQFALHYAFESEAKAKTAIANVAKCLRKGGHFVGTIPDANAIVKSVRLGGRTKKGERCFGSKNFRITFPEPHGRDMAFPDSQPFGLKYRFFLKDSVIDCEEFLVHPDTFMRLCAGFDLKCVLFQNFHDFYEEAMSLELGENTSLRDSFAKSVMGIKGGKAAREADAFPASDWEICGLYAVFAFRKTSGSKELPRRKFGEKVTMAAGHKRLD